MRRMTLRPVPAPAPVRDPDQAEEEVDENGPGDQQEERDRSSYLRVVESEDRDPCRSEVLADAGDDVRDGLRRGIDRQPQASLRRMTEQRRRAAANPTEQRIRR